MHFICVHGVLHGGWCWDQTAQDLRAMGHTVATPDLPLTSLEDDAQTIIDLLDEIDGPKALVGHSYGGLVISKAAGTRTDIDHLYFVAAIMADANEIFLETSAAYPTKFSEALNIHDDGTFTVVKGKEQESFYHKCPPDIVEAAIGKLRPTAMACLMGASGASPWDQIPATYIVCRQDQAIDPALQDIMAKRAKYVVELDTDHSPFASMPKEFLAILTGAPTNA